MNNAEKIREQYETGYKVFERLFALSDVDLKDKLRSVLQGKVGADILGKNVNVRRVICNGIYDQISIEWYDSIEITAFGIDFKPEHGNRYILVEFNQHFVL